MKKIFANEWKRVINIRFVLAIIGVMFCICFDSWNDLINAMQNDNDSWSVYYFMSNSAFGGMCRNYLLPVFATLPFAASFCEERNSKAVSYIAFREGRRKYGAVKYMVTIISGGLVVALGTILLFFVLRTRMQIADASCVASISDASDLFHKWLAVYHPIRYCMTETLLGFMRGMVWSGISILVSLYLTDSMVIMMFPFLGSYVVVRVCQMLSLNANWRFDYILIGRTVIKNSEYTLMIASTVSCVLVFLIGCVFVRKMERGLKDGLYYESK